MEEIWKEIPNYEGLYQVSNLGNVRSMDRYIVGKDGIPQKRKGVLMQKQVINSGYLVVGLRKDGKKKTKLLHRLVASAFIENPNSLKYVNHKDENKSNNCASNLEWCTPKYNANYGTAIEKLSLSHKNHPALSKKILMFDKKGRKLKEFLSIHDASRATGIKDYNISRCCNNVKYYNSAGGYVWKFKEQLCSCIIIFRHWWSRNCCRMGRFRQSLPLRDTGVPAQGARILVPKFDKL